MEMTQEQIEKSITAAFDSVDLINRNEDDVDTIERNIEHLRIMMGKDWFTISLTTEQTNQINSVI
jgi:hypothetical protein